VERYGLILSSGKKKRKGDEIERKLEWKGEKRAGSKGLVVFILVEWNGARLLGLPSGQPHKFLTNTNRQQWYWGPGQLE
jgi:hypothetical protein